MKEEKTKENFAELRKLLAWKNQQKLEVENYHKR